MRRSTLLMIALAALWGASYLFIKVALRDFGPGFVVFARVFLGACVLVPVAVRTGAFGRLRGHLRALTVVGLVQIVTPLSLIAIGEQWISSSLAGVLNGTVPIFVALIALRLDRSERASGWRIAGIVSGFTGVMLVLGLDVGTGSWALLGAAALLGSSIGYAIGPLYAKSRLADVPPVGIAAGLMTVASTATLPAAILSFPDRAPSLSPVVCLIVLGVGGTGLAFLGFYTVMQEIGPGRASVIAYMIPAFAVGYGAVVESEPIGAGAVAGLALILLGSYLAGRGRTAAPEKRSSAARPIARVPA